MNCKEIVMSRDISVVRLHGTAYLLRTNYHLKLYFFFFIFYKQVENILINRNFI